MAMRRPACVALGLVVVAAAGGVGGCLRERGVRTFDELGAAEAVERLGDAACVVVQPREPESRAPSVAGASFVDSAGPVPRGILEERRLVVVVASEPTAARRLAAQLVRAGVPRVAVVRGGIQAWMAAAPGGAAPSAARRGAERDRNT
jgi:rhodanese-related sulfurtransferase